LELACILDDRVEDFVDGEGRRCIEFETSFSIRRSKANPGPNAAWVKTTTYWCAFGPENILAQIPNKIPKRGTYPDQGKNNRPRRQMKSYNQYIKR
jgi:hypothetical protein